MIAKNINHGSHDLLPHAVATGRFFVIILLNGLFAPDLALLGGVHTPHEVMLTPKEFFIESQNCANFLALILVIPF